MTARGGGPRRLRRPKLGAGERRSEVFAVASMKQRVRVCRRGKDATPQPWSSVCPSQRRVSAVAVGAGIVSVYFVPFNRRRRGQVVLHAHRQAREVGLKFDHVTALRSWCEAWMSTLIPRESLRHTLFDHGLFGLRSSAATRAAPTWCIV